MRLDWVHLHLRIHPLPVVLGLKGALARVAALVATGAMGYAAFDGGRIVHNNPTLEQAPTSPLPSLQSRHSPSR